jgi:hypothetical protein
MTFARSQSEILTILLLGTLLAASGCNNEKATGSAGAASPPVASPGAGYDDSLKRHSAFMVALWGMPIVATDAMRDAFLHDAGANYTDVVYFSKPGDWKIQLTTPNGSTYYVATTINLAQGPMVFDLPAAVGAGLFGSMNDAWQTPIADVGPAGQDAGKGGRYLVLPPGYKGDVPAGYFPVRFSTINGYCFMRAIPEGSSQEAVRRALDLVGKIKIYPLSQAAHPPESRHIDMAGKLYNGIPKYDDSFYDRLAKILNEEPVQERDLAPLGEFRTLGYEHGKPFDPDAATRTILKDGIHDAQVYFMAAISHGEPFYPGKQWQSSASRLGAQTGFSFQTPEFLAIAERGATFFMGCAPPKKLGAATFYLNGVFDSTGHRFDGSKTYTLHVPANVPAKQFWATTIYDYETGSFLWESPKIEINSYQNPQKNADGSTDLYFGPKAPEGKEANWVYTKPGKSWFMVFRFYGPQPPLFDKTWQLLDVVKVE